MVRVVPPTATTLGDMAGYEPMPSSPVKATKVTFWWLAGVVKSGSSFVSFKYSPGPCEPESDGVPRFGAYP